jgi:hypothetical protein
VTRLFIRCMALVLIIACCCAVFTICASAADAPSGTANFAYIMRVGSSQYEYTYNASLGQSNSDPDIISSALTSLTIVLPSAGTAIFSIVGAGYTTVSGNGVTSTLSGNTLSVTVVATSGGSVGITTSPGSKRSGNVMSFSLSSWTPDSGSGGGENPDPGDGDHSGNTNLGPSSGGYDGWNSDGTFSGGQTVEGSTQKWEIHNTYIGQLDYYITDEVGSTPAIVYIAKNLANITHDSWSWKVNPDGTFTYVRPNPGSWLDNMWQMNIYLYYNLANQKGWFGHINSEFAMLNSRVLQILSVLANDEDVKIKDATTSERTWIQNYFEGNDPVGPSAGNFTDLRSGFGSITDQFETDKSITDIGSVFSDSAYDSRSQFFFWSQTVSDDVNGVSRGGFGGGKAPARAPAVSDSTFSDQYEYGDDSIVDAFDFIGGSSDG